MSVSRTLAIVSSVTLLALGAAVLAAQQQPRVPLDPGRALEARYQLTYYPWWDVNRGTPFPSSMAFGDPSGQLRLLNKAGEVQTKDHAFFTPLGSNGRACITCHQPASAMSISVDLIRNRWADTNGKDPLRRGRRLQLPCPSGQRRVALLCSNAA
jgi:hypothetical protein